MPFICILYISLLIRAGAFNESINFDYFISGMDTNYCNALHYTGTRPEWGSRILVLFAFLQSVHYWVWLRVIPSEDRHQETTRSFRKSYKLLCRDMEKPLIWIVSLASIAFVVWALKDIERSRAAYLEFVSFHVYLELYAVLILFLSGRGFFVSSRAEA